MRLYLDASAIIYGVEATGALRRAVATHTQAARTSANGAVVTSILSRLECRVGPLRRGDTALLGSFDRFFEETEVLVFDIDSAVIDRATGLRAQYGFRAADAIHMATAILAEADLFLTGDGALARCKEMRVGLLDPAAK